MNQHRRGVLIIHFCVLLWGFTAILGALITVQSVPLVLWRVIMSGGILAALVWWRGWQQLPAIIWQKLILIGALVGIHWIAFYGSIKLANASIGVVTISTASFFTAVFGPLINRTPVKWNEVLLGLLIIPSIFLIVGNVDWKMQLGFWVGILAASLVGVFTSYTKQVLEEFPNLHVMQASLIQMCTIAVLISLFLPVFKWLQPDAVVIPMLQTDWLYLFLLSAFCTVLPFTLSMHAMKSISPFTSTLILNLEPVYGVLLAIVILREDKELNLWFYLGVALLFVVVFGHSMYHRAVK
jgi:drug/metabolite transporter (DMT)-like permease